MYRELILQPCDSINGVRSITRYEIRTNSFLCLKDLPYVNFYHKLYEIVVPIQTASCLLVSYYIGIMYILVHIHMPSLISIFFQNRKNKIFPRICKMNIIMSPCLSRINLRIFFLNSATFGLVVERRMFCAVLYSVHGWNFKSNFKL